MTYHGRWHGKEVYFGLHYDLHANDSDTAIGARCEPEALAEALKLMAPDWVQTDCKGHPGQTSWYSQAPTATVCAGMKKDALSCWREATKKLGLPLHCHYSGIWDAAAARKFPHWRAIDREEPHDETAIITKMCPRSPYADELMIPQMKELVDRYGVDGFWIDGDIWAVTLCYCDRCRAEFARRTGIKEPPESQKDANWVAWRNFQLDSFNEYVTHYVEEIHRHKPGVLVCSNWLQTFSNPGEPKIPTDWISGDNASSWGLDASRVEARFLSTRGKPWDVMIWSFYSTAGMATEGQPWITKPADMMKQEAAVVAALGGNVQFYENPRGLRDGRLAPWVMERLGEVGAFVKARRALCQDAETIPQVAVLHSEHHHYSHPGRNLLWGYETGPVRGAVEAILENSYGVDCLDEWALLPRVSEFPVIVCPEQDQMSDAAVEALRKYVEAGGRLLVTGANMYQRFGEAFLGARSAKEEAGATYFVTPCADTDAANGDARGGCADGPFSLYGEAWRLIEPTTATPLGPLGTTCMPGEDLLPHPHAVVNSVGRGRVVYVPAPLFHFFHENRAIPARRYVGTLLAALAGDLPFEVRAQGPSGIDAVLRRKGGRRIVHLINRTSGTPNRPSAPAIDEMPPIGPITVEVRLDRKPKSVTLAYEKTDMEYRFVPDKGAKAQDAPGRLIAIISDVRIHSALVVE